MRRPPFPHPATLCYSSEVMPEHTTHSPSLVSHLLCPFRGIITLIRPSRSLLHVSSFISSPTFSICLTPPLLPCSASAPGCCSDTEADSVFRMANTRDTASYRRSVAITPKANVPFNQFLPSKDKPSGYVPAPLRKKRAERNEDSRRSWADTTYTEDEGTLTRYC